MADLPGARRARAGLPVPLRAGLVFVAILLLAALGALAADLRGWQRARLREGSIHSVLLQSRMMVEGLLLAESGERAFLLTGRDVYLEDYRRARAPVPQQAAVLERDGPAIDLAGQVSALGAAARAQLRTLDEAVARAEAASGAPAGAPALGANARAEAAVDESDERRAMAETQRRAELVRQAASELRSRSDDAERERRVIAEIAAILVAGAACVVLGAGIATSRRAERLARARLQALMGNAAAGVAIFDGSLRCLHANDAFRDLLQAGADPLGRTLHDLLPADSALLQPGCDAVFGRGAIIEGLALSRAPGQAGAGRPARDWLVSLYPVPGPRGGVGGLGMMTVDITAQRVAERRLAFQLRLEEQLRDLTDPGALKSAACELVARELGAAHATYAEAGAPGSAAFQVYHGWTDGRVADAPGVRAAADYGPVLMQALVDRKQVSVDDAAADPRLDGTQIRADLARRGIAAFASVMVEQHGKPAAVLFVSDAAPRLWSDTDMAVLADAAVRAWSAVERGHAATAMAESEDRFQRAIQGAGIGIWDWDLTTNEVVISRGGKPAFHDRLKGSLCTQSEFLASVHADDAARMQAALEATLDLAVSGEPFLYEAEFRVLRRRGDVRWVRSQGRVTKTDAAGKAIRLSGVTVDINARRLAEDALTAAQDRLRLLNQDLEAQVRVEVEAREQVQSRLAQARRLEALAQLSAGIAHDFNNVLQAITGSLALVQRRAGEAEAVRQLAAMASDAAARGGAITGRLLSFARQGELQPLPIQAAPLLRSLTDMLQHMVGQSISVHVDAAENLPPLLADKGQLEAVLVNLALNGRDAMPAGGTLTISARVETVGEEDLSPAGLPPGAFMRLSLADTGVGMSAATLARASEPFFTTKPIGHGTGLGLAMARGFAEQSNGGLLLTSKPGHGTIVSIWLPLALTALVPASAAPGSPGAAAGAQTRVLLVDDDALVREVLAGQMEDLGYRVARAQSGAVALARLDADEIFDIMITDYAMPGMNGAVLIAETRLRRPFLPILMLTGFADATLHLNMGEWDSSITMLLRKPASSEALAKAAAAVMHRTTEIIAAAAGAQAGAKA